MFAYTVKICVNHHHNTNKRSHEPQQSFQFSISVVVARQKTHSRRIMSHREGFAQHIKPKTGRQNSANSVSSPNPGGGGASGTNKSSIGTAAAAAAAATNVSATAGTDEYVPIFYQEISDIMRGFGDCEHPMRDSVLLIDKIVLQQLRGILNEVLQLAVDRKGRPAPSQKDFELLMQKNPVKVFRLQKHMRDLQKRRQIQVLYDMRTANFSDELDVEGNLSDDEIDRDVSERYDEEKTRRVFRADRISQSLNGDQYMEYNTARRSSFYGRNSSAIRTKLRMWLKAPADGVLSNQVYTILSYLAHETIAAIVDFAILTRLTSANRTVDPFGRITAAGTCIAII